MDALKAEEQKITIDIEEFINRRAKEGADLDAEAEALAKEKEEIKVALMENEHRLELFSLKKQLMEEDIWTWR